MSDRCFTRLCIQLTSINTVLRHYGRREQQVLSITSSSEGYHCPHVEPSPSPRPALPCPLLFLTPTLSAGMRPPPPLPQPAAPLCSDKTHASQHRCFHLTQPALHPLVGPDFFMPSASAVCCTLAVLEHICLVIIISQHPGI